MNSEVISNLIASYTTTLSTIVVVGVAIYGLIDWKRQMKGKSDYEIARRYLKAALQLRDAIKFVRNPFIPVGEMQSALEASGRDPEEYEDSEKTNKAVYSTRWKKVVEAWTNLEIESLEAEVSWGPDGASLVNPLNELVRELRGAIEWYLQKDPEPSRCAKKLLYDCGEEDEFSKKITNEIQRIKDFLKPHLV